MSDRVSFSYLFIYWFRIFTYNEIFYLKPEYSPAATPRSNVSSPGPDLPAFEDEGDLLGDLGAEMEEEEGEELFGDNMEK